MKRLFTIVAATLLFAVAAPAAAQEATLPIDGIELAPGVKAEILPTSTDRPTLYRVHFAPGATYSFYPNSSLDIVYVESGELTFQLDLPVTVAQIGATDAEGEVISAGTEFTVTAGDYFVLPPFVAGDVRNGGQQGASVTLAAIVPEGMATPAA